MCEKNLFKSLSEIYMFFSIMTFMNFAGEVSKFCVSFLIFPFFLHNASPKKHRSPHGCRNPPSKKTKRRCGCLDCRSYPLQLPPIHHRVVPLPADEKVKRRAIFRESSRNMKKTSIHPWRLTAGTCHHGGLVQIIFLSKWVMAVGSSRSSSRVYPSWIGFFDVWKKFQTIILPNGGLILWWFYHMVESVQKSRNTNKSKVSFRSFRRISGFRPRIWDVFSGEVWEVEMFDKDQGYVWTISMKPICNS